MLTLHEVSKKTGLSQNFIRLTKTKLGDILTPYIYRGEKNKLLFDESVIFTIDLKRYSKMKQLKSGPQEMISLIYTK